jgi:hypothetical protein
MAIYKVLYWQEVPTQIRAEDDQDEVAVELDARFLQQIDILASRRGLTSADDYLAQFQWSEDKERPGSAQEVADAVKAELEEKGFS